MEFIIPTPESSFPSYLDFVADRTLIEKYAKDPTASPSLPKLIDLILRQNLESLNEPYQRLMRCHRVDLDDRTYRTVRRIRANKTLTLMLASAVGWNLDKIEKDMSITMQFCLVQDLMNTVFCGTMYCSSIPEPVENPQDPGSQELRMKHNYSRLLSSFVPAVLQTLEDQCIFGLLIYARWILRAHIQRKIPKRPAKGGIVSMGNITDPDVLEGLDQQSQGYSLIWTLFRQISREKVAQTSVDLLEYIVKLDKRSLRVPVVDSFVIPSNELRMVEENLWDKGITVDFMEFRIQILYDLAGYWLFEGKIAQSADLLQRVHVLFREISPESFSYCEINMDKLAKMCRIAGVATVPSPTTELTVGIVVPDLTPSMKAKLIEILLDDLPVGKISPAMRNTLELEVRASEDPSEKVHFQRIRLCNLLREYVSGAATPSAMQLRGKLLDASAADLDWFRTILNGQRVATDVRTVILEKLRFLGEKNLLPTLVKTRLADLLALKAASTVVVDLSDCDVDMKSEGGARSLDDSLKALRTAYTYSAVKAAVGWISNVSPSGVRDLIPAWTNKIPPGLESSFSKLAWTSVMTETVTASFARSAEMAEEGCFRAARQLLKAGRLDWHTFPKPEEKLEKKFDRNLRWQNIYLDLVESQAQLTGKTWSENVRAEADRRAKVCMKAAFFKTPDEEPVPSYVQDLAVLVLYNIDEWGFVKEVTQDQKRKSSFLTAVFPFLKQLNAACAEYQQQRDDLLLISKGGKSRQKSTERQESLKLWNMLASILSRTEPPTSVLRRPVGPNPSATTISLEVLWPLIRSIRHKATLSVLFTAFCRMWSLVNRELRGLTTILDPLWPATLPLHATIQPGEASIAMEHMIEVTSMVGMDEADVVTLKGDFYYQTGDYVSAVRFYLLSALPTSVPGFLHPATTPTLGPAILKKMISCFESLHCHTYVAVLCQLVQPVDYDTAFRSVSEKVTYDAADGAYSYIWDPLILEHAAFALQKYGFLEKRQVIMDLLQSTVLNAANPPAVAQNVASERTAEFFEVLFDQYVVG